MYSYLPIISKVTDSKESFDNANMLVLRFITFLILPISFIVSIFSYPIVNLIYGPTWIEVSKYISYTFSISTLMAINLFFSTVFTSTFNYKYNLYTNIILMITTLIALSVILPFGLIAYLQIIVLAHALLLIINIYIAIRKNVLTLKQFALSTIPALPITFIIGLIYFLFIRELLTDYPQNWLNFFSIGILFIIYFVLARIIFNRFLLSIIEYLPIKNFIKRIFLYY